MNTVNFIGNIAKEPHFIAADGEKKAVCYIVVANNDKKEAPIFGNITVFGKVAEFVNDYLSKGKKVAIEGEISTRPNTSQGGDKYIETYILCHRLENLSPKEEG